MLASSPLHPKVGAHSALVMHIDDCVPAPVAVQKVRRRIWPPVSCPIWQAEPATQPTLVEGSQFSVQSFTFGTEPPIPLLSVRMQSPPGAWQSASVSQNATQLLSCGVVWTHRPPAAQVFAPPHTCPIPAIPLGTQSRPMALAEHCSMGAQPH